MSNNYAKIIVGRIYQTLECTESSLAPKALFWYPVSELWWRQQKCSDSSMSDSIQYLNGQLPKAAVASQMLSDKDCISSQYYVAFAAANITIQVIFSCMYSKFEVFVCNVSPLDTVITPRLFVHNVLITTNDLETSCLQNLEYLWSKVCKLVD